MPNLGGVKEVSFNGEKFTELCRVCLTAAAGFHADDRRRIPAAVGAARRQRLVLVGGRRSAPDLVNALYAACVSGRLRAGAQACSTTVSRLWLLFKDQYPSSLKGGMALMGRSRRPDPRADADRERRARRLSSARSWKSSASSTASRTAGSRDTTHGNEQHVQARRPDSHAADAVPTPTASSISRLLAARGRFSSVATAPTRSARRPTRASRRACREDERRELIRDRDQDRWTAACR